ncbi:19372_t:CDS:2 [Funneliformis geosporum]|uniref:Amino-acid acetyltransferase, mitochondrial n=1 Tax=Funneliformis geosporum TaxID=1117311 RepID=A0A9W4SCY1_9GLOM|nr:19372_t:CDS:2 [Funneliformis geosporum]CAI2164753.1 15317_t:CDS:2 [Funneliformis geosporum]
MEQQQKVELPIFMPKKRDRDLIMEVLSTVPSQKEAQSYIKRFTIPNKKPPAPKPVPTPLPIPLETKMPISDVQSTVSETDVQKHNPQLSLNSQKTEFVDSLFATKLEHIALIKIQGPFTTLDLKSIAKTLVHLQQLGLMPIAVLDNDEWKEMLREGPSRFSELRQWMMEDSSNICEALEDAGGRATPIHNGVFTLTHDEYEKSDKKVHRPRLKLRTLSTDVDAKINVSFPWLKTSLKLGQIPLIFPIALDGLSIQRTISPNAGMIALSSSLSDLSNATCLNLKTPHLEPMKIIVINSEGGIPSEERKGSHVFINIQQEYEDIKNSYKSNPQWKFTHPTGIENLEMIKTCLEKLPSTTSAIMAPAYSPTGLISNLITDKPLFSSSLPVTAPTTPSTTTTVIRHGMPVLYHNSLSTVDIPSLQSLIEASFKRKLDIKNYVARLEKCLELVIVTGDYQGAAIITMEDVEGNTKGDIPYLDKFAVAPNNQGVGIADILWKQLQIRYPNLMWRSRENNGVNKWYFERSNGNYRVPETHWTMFWYGNDGINELKTYTEITKNIPASFHCSST